MKYLIIPLLLITTCYSQSEESFSSVLGTTNTKDIKYTMVYQFPLTNRDGTVTQLKLIKFDKENCVMIDGVKGCSAGFTETINNFKRKYDPEHLIDTTETINLTFTMKGKTPVVSEEDILHELNHSNFNHYMSREICETNYRYPECQEALAYNYTHLVRQVRDLQRLKLIKINTL